MKSFRNEQSRQTCWVNFDAIHQIHKQNKGGENSFQAHARWYKTSIVSDS